MGAEIPQTFRSREAIALGEGLLKTPSRIVMDRTWILSPRVFVQQHDSPACQALWLDRGTKFSDISMCEIVTALWRLYEKVRTDSTGRVYTTHTLIYIHSSHSIIESQIHNIPYTHYIQFHEQSHVHTQ